MASLRGVLLGKLAADLGCASKRERNLRCIILTSERVLLCLLLFTLFSTKYERILYARKVKACSLIPRHTGGGDDPLSLHNSPVPPLHPLPYKLGVPAADGGMDNTIHARLLDSMEGSYYRVICALQNF